MKMPHETNKEEELEPLLVSCFDTVEVCDKATFVSYLFDGLYVTYWHEEAADEDARIDRMFAILFEEVKRRRKVVKLASCLKEISLKKSKE